MQRYFCEEQSVENVKHYITKYMSWFLRCGNKFDLKSKIQVSDADMEGFCEQCRNLVSGVYKTSCKTGEGVEEMFRDISKQLASTNKYYSIY